MAAWVSGKTEIAYCAHRRGAAAFCAQPTLCTRGPHYSNGVLSVAASGQTLILVETRGHTEYKQRKNSIHSLHSEFRVYHGLGMA